ncbi:MAG: hypothetical protein ABR598_08035 [Candidatus Dormibacteria bacterium]
MRALSVFLVVVANLVIGQLSATPAMAVGTAVADLSLSKGDLGNFVAGRTGTYTFTVHNGGPNDVPAGSGSLIVTDPLPKGMTYVSNTNSGTAGWTCTVTTPATTTAGDVVTCSNPSGLPNGASSSFNLVVQIDAGAAGSATNTATVSSNTSTDPIPSNNSASDVTTVGSSSDLAVTKTHCGLGGTAPTGANAGGPDVAPPSPCSSSLHPGDYGVYYITVSNAGPSQYNGKLKVHDQLSAGINYVAPSAASTPPPCQPTSLASTSSSGTGQTVDCPGPAPFTPNPDVTLKTPSQGCGTASPPATGGCTYTYSFYFQVLATDSPANYPNTVNLVTPACGTTGQVDPNCANNHYTDPTTVTAPPPTLSDLEITKTHTGTFLAGSGGTPFYNITVTDASDSANSTSGTLTVTDTLPNGFTFDHNDNGPGAAPNSAGSGTPGWTCVVTHTDPSTGQQTVTCTYDTNSQAGTDTPSAPSLSPGPATTSCPSNTPSSTCFHLFVRVAPSTPADANGSQHVNVACVADAGGTADSSPGDDCANDPTAVDQEADLSITKSPSNHAFTAGSQASYTIGVANAGPSDATNLRVVDTLPSGMTYASTSGLWSCSGTTVVTCTLPALAQGGTSSFTLNANVAPSATPGPANNTASVSSDASDPNPSNNTATTTGDSIGTSADLSITKSAQGAFAAGQDAHYLITVSNAGPSDAASPHVVDNLPAGMTYVSGTGTGWSCARTTAATASAGDVVACDYASALAAGASTSLDLKVHIANNAGGTLTNTATVSSTTNDPDGSNNTATTSTTVTGRRPSGHQLMISNRDGRLEAVALGQNGDIWHAWEASVNGTWTQWYDLGAPSSGTFASDPAIGINPDGRLEVFVTGSDSSVYHAWQTTPGGGWSRFYSLGGFVKNHGIAAIATNTDGRLELFAVGGDGAVWHAWQTSVGGGWSSWYRLGNAGGLQFVGSVGPGRNGDGRLEIVAVDTNGAMWHAWQTTPSGGWTSQFYSLGKPAGTSIAGTPGEATNADGRLEIVARGANGFLYHIWQIQPSGGWGGWYSLGGGTVASDPNLGRNGDGRLEAFATQTDGTVIHVWQTSPGGGWTGPYSIDGHGVHLVGTPQAGTDVDGRLEVLAQDADYHTMDQTNQYVPSGGWTPWSYLYGTTFQPY